MNMIKITALAAFLASVLSPLAYAGWPNFDGTLGNSTTATDIILFKCSLQAGITVSSTTVRDSTNISATPPNIRAQIAKATSATTCPASGAAGWTPVVTTSGEGIWAPRSAYISVNQTPPNNYYCIKVTKATATANADDYSLNHHCEIFPNDSHLQFSTFIKYTQNQ